MRLLETKGRKTGETTAHALPNKPHLRTSDDCWTASRSACASGRRLNRSTRMRTAGHTSSVESRGTESVLNALILSSRNAQNGQLSNDDERRLRTCGPNSKLPASRKARGSGYALRTSRGKRTIRTTSEPRWPPSPLVSHQETIGQRPKSKPASGHGGSTSRSEERRVGKECR